MNKTNQSFGQVIEALKRGYVASRTAWFHKNTFIFRQVPSEVPVQVIQKMTSLPETVKQILADTNEPLRYDNQLAIVYPSNHVHGWTPSVSDTLADDWMIWGVEAEQQEPAVAGETVGTAKPTE